MEKLELSKFNFIKYGLYDDDTALTLNKNIYNKSVDVKKMNSIKTQ